METHSQILINSVPNKLEKRLVESGWGFFLLMLGTLMLLPKDLVPEGTWLIGTGLILIGLNGIRYLNNISVSRVTIILGIAAILVGMASVFGLKLPVLALFLSAVGLSIIVRALVTAKQAD